MKVEKKHFDLSVMLTYFITGGVALGQRKYPYVCKNIQCQAPFFGRDSWLNMCFYPGDAHLGSLVLACPTSKSCPNCASKLEWNVNPETALVFLFYLLFDGLKINLVISEESWNFEKSFNHFCRYSFEGQLGNGPDSQSFTYSGRINEIQIPQALQNLKNSRACPQCSSKIDQQTDNKFPVLKFDSQARSVNLVCLCRQQSSEQSLFPNSQPTLFDEIEIVLYCLQHFGGVILLFNITEGREPYTACIHLETTA